MFVDRVDVEVQAGGGGNGAVSFRHEKFVPRGGPDGGDGGRGGSIVLEIDGNLSTLLDFRYKHKYKAARGGDGQAKKCFGHNAADLVLKVPAGTMCFDAGSNELLADLTPPQTRAVLAKGGAGGRGNTHFANSVHQVPKFSEQGEPGQVRSLRLELKLLADVGLLGYPSVGKSTLIAAVSAARPKIADYPFTTLVPNLGVVYVDEGKSFVVADLPGLIEGAHAGAGLGHQFLRHVERTRILVHMLDVSGMTGRDPLEDYAAINRELVLFSDALSMRRQIVVLNKIDVAPDRTILDDIEHRLADLGCEVHRISAATREGLERFAYTMWDALQQEPREQGPVLDEVTIRARTDHRPDARDWTVHRDAEGIWVVEGQGIERLVTITDMNNDHAVRRFQRALERLGVHEKLKAAGVGDHGTVRIAGMEFDYDDEDARDAEDTPRRGGRTGR